MWLCRCDCGVEKIIWMGNLISGHTKSCGCLCIERIKSKNTTHGHSVGGKISSEYHSWKKMIERCNDEKANGYKIYGGRGVKVCDRWSGQNGFDNFIDDIGLKPTDNYYSIDRIDSNGNYEPGNCKWSTRKEQNQNRCNSIKITVDGIDYNLTEFARIANINYSALYGRVKAGWSVDRIVNTPTAGWKEQNVTEHTKFVKNFNTRKIMGGFVRPGDDLTPEQALEKLNLQNNKCVYFERCGVDRNLTIDHIISKSNGGFHTLSNIQWLCLSCNSSKGSK